MGRPSSRRRMTYMIIQMILCTLFMSLVVLAYENWFAALLFTLLYGLLGTLFRTFQFYYATAYKQLFRSMCGLIISWCILHILIDLQIMTFLINAGFLLVWSLLMRNITLKRVSPASSVIVYDTEENREKARGLASRYDSAMRVLHEFAFPRETDELASLEKYIDIFRVQQLCLCMEKGKDTESLLELCKKKEMAVVVDAPISEKTRRTYTLQRMEYFRHKYFSTLVS